MRIAHWTGALIAVLILAAAFRLVHSQQHLNDTLQFEASASGSGLISRSRRSPKKQHPPHESWYDAYYKHDIPLQHAGEMLTLRQNRHLVREEYRNRSESGGGVDCCPSVLEMIEPEGGKNMDDQYVELYRDGANRQRFYELSCHQDILDKPCRFVDRKLHGNSRCIQKYSYTYALVKQLQQRGSNNYQFPSFQSATRSIPNHNSHHHRSHGGHHRAGRTGAEGDPEDASGGGAGGNDFQWTLDYIRVRSGCSCVIVPPTPKAQQQSHSASSAGHSQQQHQTSKKKVSDKQHRIKKIRHQGTTVKRTDAADLNAE